MSLPHFLIFEFTRYNMDVQKAILSSNVFISNMVILDIEYIFDPKLGNFASIIPVCVYI